MALSKVKRGKATGPTTVVSEIMKEYSRFGIR